MSPVPAVQKSAPRRASSPLPAALLSHMDTHVRRHPTARYVLGMLVWAAAMIVLAATAEVSRAAACDPPVTNAVACENTKPGADPST